MINKKEVYQVYVVIQDEWKSTTLRNKYQGRMNGQKEGKDQESHEWIELMRPWKREK